MTPTLQETKSNGAQVCHEHNSGNYSVGDNVAGRRASEPQTKSAVQDTEDHQDTTIPNVDIADDTTTLVLGVVAVVQPAKNRLETEKGDDNGTQNCMALLAELISVSIWKLGFTELYLRSRSCQHTRIPGQSQPT